METQDDLGTDTTESPSTEIAQHQELPRGTTLGRYVIIEPIGTGGMGTVYRAYDPELNRGIALKILTLKQVDSQAAKKAKTRLIREAQALAQLSHPNVVAVHDVGSFGEDVFIAMELVRGKTLQAWLEAKNQSVKKILEVMSAAGRGLSAAHKAGLIHRDFKPGNVIVGDDNRVRVLDFGLARAVDEEHNDDPQEAPETTGEMDLSASSTGGLRSSSLTRTGGIVGTPLYMAPEQHLGYNTNERSDQYSFCLVLYEALYKKRPFAARTLKELKQNVLRHRLRPPPRETPVPVWLWNIVHKGLSAEPQDRYPTLEVLLQELDQDPEQVRYEQQRERRRRLLVIILISMTFALPIAAWYGLRYRTVQLCKSTQAEFEGVWDQVTQDAIRHTFLGTQKSYAQGTWERVKRNFDRYHALWNQMRSDVCEARLIRGTQSEELFDLRMSCLRKHKSELGALVNVFKSADASVVQKAAQASASLSDLALCADEEALRAPYPPPKTAADKTKVADIRKKLAEVEAFSKTGQYRPGLALARKLEQEANQVAYRPIQAEVLYWLGELQSSTGEYQQAAKTLDQASRLAGETRYALLAAKALILSTWVIGYRQAKYEVGLSIARDAEVMLGIAGGNNTLLSRLRNNLGVLFFSKGDYPKALQYYRKPLALREQSQAVDHPDLATTLNNIGVVYYNMGEYDKSLQYYQRSHAIFERLLGANHPHVSMLLNNIGGVHSLQGEYHQARKYYEKSLAIREKALGRDHHTVAMSLDNLGQIFCRQGNYDKSLQYHQRALTILEKSLGPSHHAVAYPLDSMGYVLQKKGEFDRALQVYQRALSVREQALGPQHHFLVSSLSGMGDVLIDKGVPTQALIPLERVWKICQHKTCDPEPYALGLFALARALRKTDHNRKRAIQLATQAQRIFGKTPAAFAQEIATVKAWLRDHKN